jgi:hypothetical protein
MKRTPQTRERRNDQFPRRPKHANQVGLHSAETVPFLVNLGGWFYDRHNPRSARRSDLSSMHLTDVCRRHEPFSGLDVFDSVRRCGAGMTAAGTRTRPVCPRYSRVRAAITMSMDDRTMAARLNRQML